MCTSVRWTIRSPSSAAGQLCHAQDLVLCVDPENLIAGHRAAQACQAISEGSESQQLLDIQQLCRIRHQSSGVALRPADGAPRWRRRRRAPPSRPTATRAASQLRVCASTAIQLAPRGTIQASHTPRVRHRGEDDPFLESLHEARRQSAGVQAVVDPDATPTRVPGASGDGQQIRQGRHAIYDDTGDTLAWTSRMVSTVSSSCSRRKGL